MPTPTETTPAPPTAFDPLVFWIEHRTKVLILAALFVVGLGGFGISEWSRQRTQDASQELLAAAKNANDYRHVIEKYPKTVAAGNAHLLLADALRAEGKYDESTAILRTFTDKYSEHPLATGGWTSIAANLEAQGKIDEALSTYQKVATSYGNTFSAPAAYLAQARILRAKGRADEAKRIYEQVITQYPDSLFAQQAVRENQQTRQ